MAAIAAGCSSVSEMIEKLGRGELSVIASDAVQFDPMTAGSKAAPALSSAAQHHIHIHPPAATAEPLPDEDVLIVPGATFPKLVLTGACAAMIVGSLLYIGDRILTLAANLFDPPENIEDIVTPRTGEVVAGYEVSDEYGIRPVHPVTGEANVMHNGVDLATPIGTPIYAVGKAGDRVTVECWWDVDGGGQVVDQVAESYPGYVFQSLHMSEKGCQSGEAKAGEVIAYSGNSGLGTGAHYDFRVKIDGEYVPPATKYLESAVTGEPPKE
jgi:murein DD-endopeptidase MepM/ murein hydrolase activator NlpD